HERRPRHRARGDRRARLERRVRSLLESDRGLHRTAAARRRPRSAHEAHPHAARLRLHSRGPMIRSIRGRLTAWYSVVLVVVVVGQSLAPQEEILGDLRKALLLTIPLALLIASAGGYLLARKSLEPVAAMSAKARAIGASSLGERIEVRNERDELGQLATTLNGLLARLEEAFASQRRFMADASHELRTPVAILQGELDVALSRGDRDAR